MTPEQRFDFQVLVLDALSDPASAMSEGRPHQKTKSRALDTLNLHFRTPIALGSWQRRTLRTSKGGWRTPRRRSPSPRCSRRADGAQALRLTPQGQSPSESATTPAAPASSTPRHSSVHCT